MLRSRRLLAPLLAALALVPCATAAANVPKFRMTISGTLTSTGDVTRTDCLGPEPVIDENASTFAERPKRPLLTKQGTATSTVRFKTTRPSTIYAQRMSTHGAAIALNDDHKPLRVTATIINASTLVDRETPIGCGDQTPPKSDCGTETLTFDLGVGGRGGVAPDFSKNSYKNRTTFENCPLTDGMSGFPSFTGGAGEARVSIKQLFAKRSLTLKGGRRDRDEIKSHGITAHGSYDLRYTIKLTRVN
jgi:hypothetical protein